MENVDVNSATHWKKQFNYDYLGSQDIEEGKELTLTLKETKKQEVIGGDGKKTMCFVAHFKENYKPMILNRTNCKAITRAFKTPYSNEWKDRRITIFVLKDVKAFGELVDALRVKNTDPDDTTLEEIKKLFDKHKKEMPAELVQNASNIIQSKQHLSYAKLLTYLKSL